MINDHDYERRSMYNCIYVYSKLNANRVWKITSGETWPQSEQHPYIHRKFWIDSFGQKRPATASTAKFKIA